MSNALVRFYWAFCNNSIVIPTSCFIIEFHLQTLYYLSLILAYFLLCPPSQSQMKESMEFMPKDRHQQLGVN